MSFRIKTKIYISNCDIILHMIGSRTTLLLQQKLRELLLLLFSSLYKHQMQLLYFCWRSSNLARYLLFLFVVAVDAFLSALFRGSDLFTWYLIRKSRIYIIEIGLFWFRCSFQFCSGSRMQFFCTVFSRAAVLFDVLHCSCILHLGSSALFIHETKNRLRVHVIVPIARRRRKW